MGSLIRMLLQTSLLRPVLRPVTRFLVGLVAIPLFRLFLRRVVRLQELDEELEKDLEQWFRGSLLLLVATANMEEMLFGWLPLQYDWLWIGLRLLLAIGVIEAMPDQELFAVIHPGPPKVKLQRGFFRVVWQRRAKIIKGLICKHLNRSSPVFAIMAAIFGGEPGHASHTHIVVGWVCYVCAVSQYLIIGLVTSRDKALDVLGEFDRKVAQRRRELIAEFDLKSRAKNGGLGDGSDAQRPEGKADSNAAVRPAGGHEPGHGKMPSDDRLGRKSGDAFVAKDPSAGYESD